MSSTEDKAMKNPADSPVTSAVNNPANNAVSNPMLEKLVRFQRPEQLLPFARQLSERIVADIFGVEEAEYRSVLETLDGLRTAAADRIAEDPDSGPRLRNVSFRHGAHLVALGESTTADRLSWFEILRTLLEKHRPELELRFTNLAVSGATTTQVLATLPSIRRQAADWTFCMLGSNDSQRYAGAGGPLLVSRDETLRNLTELRTRALPHDDASWVWITPTPVDEERIAEFPYFSGPGITWRNADLRALARSQGTGDDLVVDGARAVPASGAGPDALAEDGLHPGTATQERLAVQVLEALTVKGRP